MKKLVGMYMVLSFLAPPLLASANGPEVDFFATLPPIACVQVVGLQNVESQYFLVFDYDSEMGKKLGRPWKAVEEGKCYSGGSLVVLPTATLPFLKDSIAHPERYDATLDFATSGGPHNIYHECGLQDIFPDACPILFPSSENQEGDTGGIILFGHTSFASQYVPYVYGPNSEISALLPMFLSQGDRERIPAGLNTDISAMEAFKKSELLPRFARCDQRKRESTVFYLKNDFLGKNLIQNIGKITDHEEQIWTMNDGRILNATEFIPHLFLREGWMSVNPIYMRYSDDSITTSELQNIDFHVLRGFEGMGCLEEVFEVRGKLANLKDSSYSVAQYADQMREAYKKVALEKAKTTLVAPNKITDTSVGAPTEERIDIISATSSPTIASSPDYADDESVAQQQLVKEKDNKFRLIYFVALPILGVGMLALIYMKKRRDGNV